MLSIIERVMVLQSVDVLSEVATEHLAHVAAVATERSYEQGEVIFREADPSDAMYVVLEGEVRLSRGGRTVTVAREDEAFGTWSLLDDEPRVVDAVAASDCVLLRLAKDDFIDLLADNVEITQAVLKGIVMRLRAVAGRVAGDKPRQ
ncbi:MAG: cyclic nucleotide-binding domain-containing protein [Myxococcales bacterium]